MRLVSRSFNKPSKAYEFQSIWSKNGDTVNTKGTVENLNLTILALSILLFLNVVSFKELLGTHKFLLICFENDHKVNIQSILITWKSNFDISLLVGLDLIWIQESCENQQKKAHTHTHTHTHKHTHSHMHACTANACTYTR